MNSENERTLEQYKEEMAKLFEEAKQVLKGKRRLIPYYGQEYWRAKELLEKSRKRRK